MEPRRKLQIMRWLPLFLPVGALGVVAVLFAVVQFGAADVPFASSTTTAPPSEGGAPQSRPPTGDEASVCRLSWQRPEAGSPRQFPEVYTQQLEAAGLTIVAGPEVSLDALEIARETVERMFGSNDLAEPLVDEGAYLIVAAAGQGVLDLPEFNCLSQQPGSGMYTHVCGVADHADYPVATVNELDLLGDVDGPCGGLNILYHELGHLVQNFSISPQDYYDVRFLYQAALNAGKYRRQYAATNPNEYFAEGTQSYFHFGTPGGQGDREWLAEYDPELYAMLERIYAGE